MNKALKGKLKALGVDLKSCELKTELRCIVHDRSGNDVGQVDIEDHGERVCVRDVWFDGLELTQEEQSALGKLLGSLIFERLKQRDPTIY